MKKILSFLTGAIVAQGLGAVTGLLLTRWLDVDQYAVYTVVAVLTGAMTVLTTGGVNIAFSAIVGRTWPDRVRASQALLASLRERRILSAMVLPVFLVAAVWLLFRAGATPWVVGILGVLLVLQWHWDMKAKITDQVLLFAHRAVGLQTLDAVLAFIRFASIVALQFFGVLSITIVTAVGVLMAGLRVPPIQRWAKQELPAEPAEENESDRREIRSVTMRQFPVEVFYCFQGQIALYILALTGSPAETASYGALGRIAQLFIPISMLVTSYAIPHFSQCKTYVFRSFFRWSLLGLIPSGALVAVAAFAPDLLLLLIGPNYAELHYEVFIASMGSALGMFASTAWRLAANRGWNRWVLLQIPAFAVWCIFAPKYLDLSSLAGVLWFQLGFPLALMAATCADLVAAYRRDAPSVASEKHA